MTGNRRNVAAAAKHDDTEVIMLPEIGAELEITTESDSTVEHVEQEETSTQEETTSTHEARSKGDTDRIDNAVAVPTQREHNRALGAHLDGNERYPFYNIAEDHATKFPGHSLTVIYDTGRAEPVLRIACYGYPAAYEADRITCTFWEEFPHGG